MLPVPSRVVQLALLFFLSIRLLRGVRRFRPRRALMFRLRLSCRRPLFRLVRLRVRRMLFDLFLTVIVPLCCVGKEKAFVFLRHGYRSGAL